MSGYYCVRGVYDIIVSGGGGGGGGGGGYMSGYYCVQGVDDKFNIVLGVHSVFESSIGGVWLKNENGIAQSTSQHCISTART